MNAESFKDCLKERANLVEAYLAQCLEQEDIPTRLREAMRYSLLAGGKRLRPILCLSCAALFGLEMPKVLPFAAGIEMIHTYSLIHDDLPSMDDDDFRRGRLSNHKAFDEATAILAGDALLTEAFVLMASNSGGLPAQAVLSALLDIALAAGASGMVGGQMLDMQYTGQSIGCAPSTPGAPSKPGVKGQTKNLGLNELRAMHAKKTGALLKAACTAGAKLALTRSPAGQSFASLELDLKNIADYGEAIGLAFQIADDILDINGDSVALGKPVGSDEAKGKLTYPALLGLDESQRLARQESECAVRAIEQYSSGAYSGEEAAFLKALAQYIVHRIN